MNLTLEIAGNAITSETSSIEKMFFIDLAFVMGAKILQ
jgi:hypothetical protein